MCFSFTFTTCQFLRRINLFSWCKRRVGYYGRNTLVHAYTNRVMAICEVSNNFGLYRIHIFLLFLRNLFHHFSQKNFIHMFIYDICKYQTFLDTMFALSSISHYTLPSRDGEKLLIHGNIFQMDLNMVAMEISLCAQVIVIIYARSEN